MRLDIVSSIPKIAEIFNNGLDLFRFTLVAKDRLEFISLSEADVTTAMEDIQARDEEPCENAGKWFDSISVTIPTLLAGEEFEVSPFSE